MTYRAHDIICALPGGDIQRKKQKKCKQKVSSMKGQIGAVLLLAFSAQMSLHMNSTSCCLPSMFVLVEEQVAVGVLAESAGSSTSRPPVLTDQSFSVLSVIIYAPSRLSETKVFVQVTRNKLYVFVS